MVPDTSILSPLVQEHKPGEGWTTPVRSSVRAMRCRGMSYGAIKKETGLERSTIQRMVKAESSRSARKGKANKPKALTSRQIDRMVKWISAS
jgi:transposase